MAVRRAVPRPMRSDGVRSRTRLLIAAAEVIARDGASASLEEIARVAGVGSATLHRHFPTRWGLLQAIFKERVDGLAALAQSLSARDPAEALEEWLVALTSTVAATQGLAAALELADDPSITADATCHHVVTEAGTHLLDRAQQAGRMDSNVTIDELLALATAISSMPDDVSRLRMLHAALVGLSRAAPHEAADAPSV